MPDKKPPPPRARFGCLFAFLAFAVVVAAIGYAIAHPWPGVGVVVLALLIAWPLAARAGRIAEMNEKAELARLRAIAPAFGDAWRKLLAEEGFGAWIEQIAPHVRPAVRLVFVRVAGDVALGDSFAGSQPLLPPGFEWPRSEGQPMRFVLQIDLADVHRSRSDLTLPREGTLYAFEPVDGGMEWNVALVAPGERVRTPSPSDAAPAQSAACAMTFEAYDDLPTSDALGAISVDWDEGQRERYEAIRDYVVGNGQRELHKLLGHPDAVQDPAEIESDDSIRLLLQLDSDAVTGWTWGDAGRVYCTVKRAALANGDLTKIEVIGQCG